MNLTKAELLVAIQAKLDADTADNSYTVAAGVETICSADELLTEDSRAIYYGTLSISSSNDTAPAEATLIANPIMAQTPAWAKQSTEKATVKPGDCKQLNNVAFSYLEGDKVQGTFTGYKFAVTTIYSLLETGYPELDENQNPIVA